MSTSTMTSTHLNGTCLDDTTSPKSVTKNGAGSGGEGGGAGEGGGGIGHQVEATDDVKVSQQHINSLETDLRHAHEALSGTIQNIQVAFQLCLSSIQIIHFCSII